MSAGDLSQDDVDQLGAEHAGRLNPAARAAMKRGQERRALESLGGGIKAAELASGKQLRCVHGHLRVLCEHCARALP